MTDVITPKGLHNIKFFDAIPRTGESIVIGHDRFEVVRVEYDYIYSDIEVGDQIVPGYQPRIYCHDWVDPQDRRQI